MANAVRTVSRTAIYCRGGSHKAQGRLCKEEILAHENWTLADTYADVEIPDSQMRGSRTVMESIDTESFLAQAVRE